MAKTWYCWWTEHIDKDVRVSDIHQQRINWVGNDREPDSIRFKRENTSSTCYRNENHKRCIMENCICKCHK